MFMCNYVKKEAIKMSVNNFKNNDDLILALSLQVTLLIMNDYFEMHNVMSETFIAIITALLILVMRWRKN